MGVGEVRIERESILKFCDGILNFSTLAVYVPQGQVYLRVVDIQSHGLLRGIPGWRQNTFRWFPAP
jgi:hypothetical protein